MANTRMPSRRVLVVLLAVSAVIGGIVGYGTYLLAENSPAAARPSTVRAVDLTSGKEIIARLNSGGYDCLNPVLNTAALEVEEDWRCTHGVRQDTAVMIFSSAEHRTKFMTAYSKLIDRSEVVEGNRWTVVAPNAGLVPLIRAALKL